MIIVALTLMKGQGRYGAEKSASQFAATMPARAEKNTDNEGRGGEACYFSQPFAKIKNRGHAQPPRMATIPM